MKRGAETGKQRKPCAQAQGAQRAHDPGGKWPSRHVGGWRPGRKAFIVVSGRTPVDGLPLLGDNSTT